MTGDTLTTIRARNRRLAKLVHADGKVDDYDRARTFDLTEHAVADLNALAKLLAALLPRWDIAVVRGAPVHPDRSRGVRRLLHADPETGESPTLRESPRRWVALDVEGITRPEQVAAADLRACFLLALEAFPAAFRGHHCIVQASASHGFKSDLRLRLWFWCDRPLTGAELKRWLRGTPADPSVFGAAQPIYTAAPLMAAGLPDPLPERIVVIPGEPMILAPSALELAPPAKPVSPGPPLAGNRYALAALTRAAANIATAEKRHPRIIAECRGLARLVHAGLLTESALRAIVMEAARRAGKQDETEIASCIAWGLANPSTGKIPEIGHG